MNINITKCDICENVLSTIVNGKKQLLQPDAVECKIRKFEGVICSLPCLAVVFTRETQTFPTNDTIIRNMQKVLPDWTFSPCDYEAKYNERKLEEVKEAMKGLRGYQLVKKESNQQLVNKSVNEDNLKNINNE
jgi:hypothetical protein